MAARKKAAKRAAPKKTTARKRPVLSEHSSSETVRLGEASAGHSAALWGEMLAEFPRLTEADRSAAELYCDAVEQRKVYQAAVAKHGVLIIKAVTKDGDAIMGDNPASAHVERLTQLLLTLAKEFGGTPKARAVKKNEKPSQAAVPGKPDVGRFFSGA